MEVNHGYEHEGADPVGPEPELAGFQPKRQRQSFLGVAPRDEPDLRRVLPELRFADALSGLVDGMAECRSVRDRERGEGGSRTAGPRREGYRGHAAQRDAYPERREEIRDPGTAYSERWHGRFERSLQLGPDVDPEKVNAGFKNGVLRITVPKRPEAQRQVKRIPINA